MKIQSKDGLVGYTLKIIYGRNMQNLEGRMLTLIDAIGLPQSQEKAIKDLVRKEVWGWFDNETTHSLEYAKKSVVESSDSDDYEILEEDSLCQKFKKVIIE